MLLPVPLEILHFMIDLNIFLYMLIFLKKVIFWMNHLIFSQKNYSKGSVEQFEVCIGYGGSTSNVNVDMR